MDASWVASPVINTCKERKDRQFAQLRPSPSRGKRRNKYFACAPVIAFPHHPVCVCRRTRNESHAFHLKAESHLALCVWYILVRRIRLVSNESCAYLAFYAGIRVHVDCISCVVLWSSRRTRFRMDQVGNTLDTFHWDSLSKSRHGRFYELSHSVFLINGHKMQVCFCLVGQNTLSLFFTSFVPIRVCQHIIVCFDQETLLAARD